MRSILDILEDTTVDGPGFRTAIYAGTVWRRDLEKYPSQIAKGLSAYGRHLVGSAVPGIPLECDGIVASSPVK